MKIFSVFLVFLLLCGCTLPEAQKKEKPTEISAEERAARLFKTKDSVAPFFKPMRIEEGDWLESFPESGQTFEEYLNANPTLPTEARKIIYIQPIGDFTAKQKEILQLTADYMQAFYNLPVKLNPEKALTNVPEQMSRKNPYEGQKQIKTAYFLSNLLPEILPADAAALICFTNYDLFPDEDWNYVFGQATLQNRVGVWSLWRFGDADKGAEDFRKFLSRTLKVAMHETGHMFSMRHCTKYECLMSGTNHLDETDRRPLDVCPECMAKIAWAMKYEPRERSQNLANFWEKQGWTEQQKSFTEKAEALRQSE